MISRVKVLPLDEPPALRGKAPEPIVSEPGTVATWKVSDPFKESSLEGQLELPEDLAAGHEWTELPAEPGGITNLARVVVNAGGNNTVWARLDLHAEKATTRAFHFGFSDRVRVYWNGRLLFSGDDTYMSRDYRFLGTIGEFDTLYLPFEEGKNQLLVAVSEDFGGWGIRGRFDSLEGLEWAP